MGIRVGVLIAAALALAGAVLSVASSRRSPEAGPSGGLRSTSTDAFVRGDGTPVVLNGLNISPVWSGTPGRTFDRDRYEAIATKGFNSVRFVLYWSDFEPQRGRFDETSVTTLDTAVARAKAAGLYVVLDMIHLFGDKGLDTVPAWARSGDSVASVQSNASGYLRMLAERFRDEPAVAAYDPVSEPRRWPIDQNAVLRMYDRLIRAIRQVDPDKIVMVEPTYGDTSIADGCADLSNLTFRENVVFSIHVFFAGGHSTGHGADCRQVGRYGWDGETGYDVADAAALRAHLRTYLDTLTPEGIPVYVGEWGMGEPAANRDAWIRAMNALFEEYGLSRAWWQYSPGRNGQAFGATNDDGGWMPVAELLVGGAAPAPPPVETPAPGRSVPVVMAAGDFTSCQGAARCARSASARVKEVMAAEQPDLILGLGDFQYQYIDTIYDGFDLIFGPKPGGLWGRIRPTAGPTHDLDGCDDPLYEQYWGRDPMKPYSFDIGGWHLISLPAAAYRHGCDTPGVLAWLQADLGANRKPCTLAFWQDPYWTRPTEYHERELKVKPWVQLLYDHDADVIVQASNHNYQRFAPQNMRDERDQARGIRSFVVGTGGITHYAFTGDAPNVEASDATTYGALKLTLRETGYDWSFEPAADGTFTDAGSGSCH